MERSEEYNVWFKKSLQDWCTNYKPNFFAVYRPKRTRIGIANVDRHMNDTVARFKNLGFKGYIDMIYYTVEEDRYKKSMHMNMLIKGDAVNKLNLSTAMNRSAQEIGYFDIVNSERAVSNYVNKYINRQGLHLAHYGLVETEQALIEEMQNATDYQINEDHPNRDKHTNSQIMMRLNGWSNLPKPRDKRGKVIN